MQINLSDEMVETFVNTTGKLSEIAKITTPDDLLYRVPNGALLVMDLRNSANEKLPADTKIVVGAKPPIKNFPSDVDKKSYRVYNSLTIPEQYDEEKNVLCKLRTKGKGVRLKEGNELQIWIESSEQIDFSNSVIEINNVVEESLS